MKKGFVEILVRKITCLDMNVWGFLYKQDVILKKIKGKIKHLISLTKTLLSKDQPLF